MNIPLAIKLHPNQEVIHKSPARIKVVKAGKRFGKSKLAVFKSAKWSFQDIGIHAYIAPFYRQAKNIAWREFNNLIPRKLIRRKLENELLIELINGSVIQLFGGDNLDSLRGIPFRSAVMDEAAYHPRYLWPNIVRGQLLDSRKPPGPVLFISSPINPFQFIGRNVEDWYTDFFNDAKRKNLNGDTEWEAFHYTIYDNPLLKKEEIDSMRNDATDEEWDIEYMAHESSYSGAVYQEFQDSHIGEYPMDGVLARSHDWGIDHPTVCLWVYIDEKNRIIYFDDEYSNSNATIEENVNIIKRKTGGRFVQWDVCDPSLAKRNSQTKRTDMDEYARLGIPCAAGDNGNRGYKIVKMLLKKNMIRIHPRCRNLINQLRKLQWSSTTNDDFTDCLRYLCVRVHDFMFGRVFDREVQEPVGRCGKGVGSPMNFNDPDVFPDREKKGQPNGWIMEEMVA